MTLIGHTLHRHAVLFGCNCQLLATLGCILERALYLHVTMEVAVHVLCNVCMVIAAHVHVDDVTAYGACTPQY